MTPSRKNPKMERLIGFLCIIKLDDGWANALENHKTWEREDFKILQEKELREKESELNFRVVLMSQVRSFLFGLMHFQQSPSI